MLGARVPLQESAFAGRGDAVNHGPPYYVLQELRAGRSHGERGPVELHPIIIGHDLMRPVPQHRPVELHDKAGPDRAADGPEVAAGLGQGDRQRFPTVDGHGDISRVTLPAGDKAKARQRSALGGAF